MRARCLMEIAYVVSEQAIPPAPDALVAALAGRGVWSDVTREESPGMLWSRLSLAHPPYEVRVSFTVGDALPTDVRTWLAWQGRDLEARDRACIERPVATYRVEAWVPDGGMRLLGPQERREPHDEGGGSDAPRRAAHFAAAVAAEIAAVTEGVLIDVSAQRFWSAARAGVFGAAEFDVRDFISVHAEVRDEGLHLHTHGLARFGRADLEMGHVPRAALSFGTHVLNEAAQHQALGHVIRHGETILVDGEYPFAVSASARSGEHVGNRVFALVDPVDAPQRDARAPRFTLARFCEDVADDLVGQSAFSDALAWLTDSTALAPWRAQAWRKRAAVLAELGRTREAQTDEAQAAALEATP